MKKTSVPLTLFFVFMTLILSGCVVAPRSPIPADEHLWDSENLKIGIYMPSVPKVETSYPGAACLLCLGVAAATNSSLSKQIDSLKPEGVADLRQEAEKLIKAHHAESLQIDAGQIDLSKLVSSKSKSKLSRNADKNFIPLMKKFGISHLLVIQADYIGAERPYSAYVPVGPPVTVLRGVSYLVNLNDNTYEFYNPVNSIRSADSTWDEPPSYPAMTNAFYQALENGKDHLLQPLK